MEQETPHIPVRDALGRARAGRPSDGARPASQASSTAVPTLAELLLIFAIGSVVGLVGETIASYPADGVWKDRAGLVWGPFSPIYGLGAVLMSVVLAPVRARGPFVQFGVAAVVGAAFEYAAGWFWEAGFGIVAWSYRSHPFDIGGYTCVCMALVWGALGVAWIRAALPWLLGSIRRIPKRVVSAAAALLAAFLAVDIAVTLMAFECWFDRQAGAEGDGPVAAYFAQHYGDDFMAERFQTMSLYAELAQRG